MREIKFRAWDKKEKKMKWVDHLSVPNFDSGAVSFLDSELKADGKYKALGEIELMQYTGLKDKNGVEIYEGDILEEEEGDLLTVFWDKQKAAFKLGGREMYSASSGTSCCYATYLLKVGNKYENPELLNVKQ
jgi:uncharacterized phage protein (TIGR01671 family)